MNGGNAMGYTTEFIGTFTINRPVSEDVASLFRGLTNTRRMKRDNAYLIEHGYGDCGIDGEFFVEDLENYGQDSCLESIIEYNFPPSTQPSLWCNWELLDDNQTICWNYAEKFYNYVEWIEYLINNLLKPKNYIVNGVVAYQGEDFDDFGTIFVRDNNVHHFPKLRKPLDSFQ